MLGPWRLLLRSGSGAAVGGSALTEECLSRGSMLARGLAPGALAPLGATDAPQAHEGAGRLEAPAPGVLHSLGQLGHLGATVAQAARNRAGQTNLTLGITQCGVVRKDQAAAMAEVSSDCRQGLRGGLRPSDFLCFGCLESRGACACASPLLAPAGRPLLVSGRSLDVRHALWPGGQWLLKAAAALRRRPRRLALACLIGGRARLLPLAAAGRLGPQSCDRGLLELPAAVVDEEEAEEAETAAAMYGLRHVVGTSEEGLHVGGKKRWGRRGATLLGVHPRLCSA